MSKHKHPAISVASPRENFRRGGHVFGTKPITLALAALHPDAHAAILADQSLVKVDTVVHLDHEEAKALPHHDAPHVKEAATKIDMLPAAVHEDHAKRALALADIEADLKEREAALADRGRQLDDREAALDERDAAIVRAHAQLDEQRKAFDEQRTAHETSKHVGAEGVAHAGGAKATGKASR